MSAVPSYIPFVGSRTDVYRMKQLDHSSDKINAKVVRLATYRKSISTAALVFGGSKEDHVRVVRRPLIFNGFPMADDA